MSTQKRLNYLVNLGLAAVAGLSGCVAVALTIGAILAGLALDSLMDTRPLITILCIISSVPLSVIVMLLMVIRSARAIEKRQYGTTK
ncbi:MAG: hypothetical protein GYB66_02155 [Chloroflexi bacterium]|nr:hypothetical protein [Chloroflexota bacterium]